jgi:hypothetical protein
MTTGFAPCRPASRSFRERAAKLTVFRQQRLSDGSIPLDAAISNERNAAFAASRQETSASTCGTEVRVQSCVQPPPGPMPT